MVQLPIRYAWTPQIGAQLSAIEADFADEMLYGGSRGGGKSDFLVGDFLQGVEEYGANWKGILFRKTNSQLEEILQRCRQVYEPLGAIYLKSDRTWTFPNGATLKLRYLEREQDHQQYQGHQYTWIGWDELGQWATDKPYKMLLACLRSPAAIPVKRVRATANPGGAGHHWIKQRFIEHAPLGYKLRRDKDTGHDILYIPSRVYDNKILLKQDPGYINRLKGVGSKALVRAWLEGDWDVVTGAYFDTFSSNRHVIEPFKIPEHWLKFRAFDWGSAKPSCCLWLAVSDGTIERFPRGSIIVFKELYTSKGNNEGTKQTVEEVADLISAMTTENITYSVADTAIFTQDGGESMAERFAKKGVKFRPADKKRIPGWEQIRRRLNDETLFIFSTATNLIRTLPLAQHDDRHPEDIDTDCEDHGIDTLRYGLMSRPYAKDAAPEPKKIRGVENMTAKELFSLKTKRKSRRRI